MSGKDSFRTAERVKANGLREQLDARGIKQVWVAQQVGISAPQMSGVLSGHRTIRAETAVQISELLGIPFCLAFKSADARGDVA